MSIISLQCLACSLYLIVGLGSADALSSECTCMNWAELYASKAVTCGQGLEMLFTSKVAAMQATQPFLAAGSGRRLASQFEFEGQKSVNSTLRNRICSQFFQKIDDNRCVNQVKGLGVQYQGLWHSGSWCYVSSDCEDLHGGLPVMSTELSWKNCQKDSDISLRELKPGQIIDLASDHDVDSSLLFEHAYYTSTDEENASPDEKRTRLMKVEREALPSLMLPTAEQEPRMVVVGHQKWALVDNELKDPDHPGTFWMWSCIDGCEV